MEHVWCAEALPVPHSAGSVWVKKRVLSLLFNEGDHERGREIKRKKETGCSVAHTAPAAAGWLRSLIICSHSPRSPNAWSGIVAPHAVLLQHTTHELLAFFWGNVTWQYREFSHSGFSAKWKGEKMKFKPWWEWVWVFLTNGALRNPSWLFDRSCVSDRPKQWVGKCNEAV